MITTTYTCDRCGMSVVRDMLHKVKLVVNDYTPEQRLKVDWCDACCRLTGLYPLLAEQKADLERRKKQAPEPLTIEDLVREIINQTISEVH